MTPVGRILIEIARQAKARDNAKYELLLDIEGSQTRVGTIVKDYAGDHFLELEVEFGNETRRVFIPHDHITAITPVWLP